MYCIAVLDNEYLIGGKDNMIKVDVSVYYRLLRRPKKLERNINYSIFLAAMVLILDEKIFYRYLWRALSKMYERLLL